MRQKLTSTFLLLFLVLGNAFASIPNEYGFVVLHPKHIVKVWTTTYRYTNPTTHKTRKKIFRVTMLPRCEHIEVFPTFMPTGETKEKAMKRLNGVAVCTSAYYNPANYRAVDFFRRDGKIIVGCEVGRSCLAIHPSGYIDISNDYNFIKSNNNIDAVALGQMLNPFKYDGFSKSFAGRVTDRMGIGLTENNIYIVQSCTDLYLMSKFFINVLQCDKAINTDGGHVVKGISPYHLVFRWKTK